MATAPVSTPRPLYPPIEPFSTGFMPVSGGHNIYYEVSGNPAGKPAVFLHGGPGSGTSPKQRCFFDPAVYKIVLFDQRGSGKSTPFASLEQNSTWDLVADMEQLRALLGIEKWLVFGGSWGSTLALAYSQSHPERVSHLVLRGIFMIRKEEIDYFYQGPGSNFIFPDAWEEYLRPIPLAERGDLVAAYHARLTSSDPAVRAEACRAWSIWEGSTSKLLPDAELVESFGGPMAESLARIEARAAAQPPLSHASATRCSNGASLTAPAPPLPPPLFRPLQRCRRTTLCMAASLAPTTTCCTRSAWRASRTSPR